MKPIAVSYHSTHVCNYSIIIRFNRANLCLRKYCITITHVIMKWVLYCQKPNAVTIESAYFFRVYIWLYIDMCAHIIPGGCHDSFQCHNGNCVANSSLCDTFNDCGDNTDELNCSCKCSSIQSHFMIISYPSSLYLP